MREQGGTFPLTMATLGGMRLGPGTALVDEDVLRLLLAESPDGEKALQFRYDAIIGVGLSDGSVVVSCRDGRGLIAALPDATAFRQGVLAACRALPEVTRALRALGSRRGVGGARRNPTDREGRFFAPFIRARRASMDARDAASVIRAFEPRELARSVAHTILAFASDLSAGHPARKRAMEAELDDAVQPLADALDRLRDLAALASSDVDDLGRWRSWAGGVQRVFDAADKSWVAIEPIVSRR